MFTLVILWVFGGFVCVPLFVCFGWLAFVCLLLIGAWGFRLPLVCLTVLIGFGLLG